MFFLATDGVDQDVVVLVRQSMMSMLFVKHMMNVTEGTEIDAPVTRSFFIA